MLITAVLLSIKADGKNKPHYIWTNGTQTNRREMKKRNRKNCTYCFVYNFEILNMHLIYIVKCIFIEVWLYF